jgi:hypothetical protein
MMGRNRLDFAAANLHVGTRAMQAHPAMVSVVALSMAASAAWAVLWAVGFVGLTALAASPSATGHGLPLLLLVSLYWGGGVAANVAHVAVAGTVGSWWRRRSGDQDGGAAWKGLGMALTGSFGSICQALIGEGEGGWGREG